MSLLSAIAFGTDLDLQGPVFPWLAAHPGSLSGCPHHGRTGHHEDTSYLPAAQRAKIKLVLPYGSVANPVATARMLRLGAWF